MTRSLLLDTCALFWLGNEPERLSEQTISVVESVPMLYASPISLWEVAYKNKIGKLELAVSPEEWFATLKAEYGIKVLPLNPTFHVRPSDELFSLRKVA